MKWRVNPDWRIEGGYAYIHIDALLVNGSTNNDAKELAELSTPSNQITLRSSYDLNSRTELDIVLRYVDKIIADNSAWVPEYWEMDIRLARAITDDIELSLVAENLLNDSHKEYGRSTYVVTQFTEVERSAKIKLEWHF